jgi:CRISPR/Cas system CSM-associated protein Csm3 (group 7 of RAMP superfamily)
MPEGENFWNPYRMVPVKRTGANGVCLVARAPLHHAVTGVSGFFLCRLTARTPLLIAKQEGNAPRGFWMAKRRLADGRFIDWPTIPGTSLKGAVRSTVELLAGGDAPFSPVREAGEVPRTQETERAYAASRLFGMLDRSTVLAGHVSISDAPLELASDAPREPWRSWKRYTVLLGSPKPAHRAFYPPGHRKLYHHDPAAAREGPRVTARGGGINENQLADVIPAPAGSEFRFTVRFENVLPKDLDLLVYALVLERDLVRPLRWRNELGVEQEHWLRGDLCHKIGHGKPVGLGSARIEIERAEVVGADARIARYRGQPAAPERFEGDALARWIDDRTAQIRNDRSEELEAFRRMAIFDPKDPRRDLRYPDYGWFRANGQRPLRAP